MDNSVNIHHYKLNYFCVQLQHYLKNTCLNLTGICGILAEISLFKKLGQISSSFFFTPHYISKYSTQLDLFYIIK